MPTLDMRDAQYMIALTAANEIGELEINRYCPECDHSLINPIEISPFNDQHIILRIHDHAPRADHTADLFSVVIGCEGYHIMTLEGKIKNHDVEDEG